MGSEMDTFAARLASFDTVLKPEKRRSSTTKGSKVIGWPHKRPSPAELAHAGFYYKPYETNPDNTTCFQCSRALDGWEEDDNPIIEHLKHSPDCAWAIMMDIQQQSSNPTMIEDPTGERITQARMGTFGDAWPHDGKRGWVCQSEKMVAGGWFFCPNEESTDLASCAYCKLSLDGWEPKDDPFDEHYRRSSDCSFFVFAQPPGKKGKGAKSKKSRTSKASSRLSTQSVATVASEAPDMDIDEAMDSSIISQATVKPKASKKGTKGKGKSAKNKKEDAGVESQMDVDVTEPAQLEPEPESSKPKRSGRGKKRASEDINDDELEQVIPVEPEEPIAEPPTKRRATRTRASSISQSNNYETQDYVMPDAAPVDEEPQEEQPKKSRKGPKKGSASKSRKASDVSVASKTTSQAHIPRDSELDAAIEAGLEADAPEVADAEPEAEPEKPRTSKKSKSSKKSKAVPKSAEPSQLAEDYVDELKEEPELTAETAFVDAEEVEAPASKTKSGKTKKKGSKKSKKQESVEEEPAPSGRSEPSERSEQPKPNTHDRDDHRQRESFVSVEIINRQSTPRLDSEVESTEKATKKKASKKEEKPKRSKKTKKAVAQSPPSAAIPQPVGEQIGYELPAGEDEEYETPDDFPDQIEMVEPQHAPSPEPQHTNERTPVPPKTAKRFSDIPQEEHLAHSFTESQHSQSKERRTSQQAPQSSDRAISPLPAAHQTTPSLSPQSSDAENHPPSSRPSVTRPPAIVTPSKELKARAPPATSTPSPSKRNLNAGFPGLGQPWTPVDIDEVLFGEASDKENADIAGLLRGAKAGLTSPEKKMTVEEWIMWNAKNGEERLKRECERLVSQFEREGDRAMRRLEAIGCIE